jgi:hypothetical protein
MKLNILFYAAFAALLLVGSTEALTRQWSVAAGSGVTSLMADGKGGCAFVHSETNGTMTIVWVDKKGTVKYEENFPVGTVVLVTECLKKAMVYYKQSGSDRELVQVDKKGQETSLTESDIVLNPLPVIVTYDKQGFFALGIDTNQIPVRTEVIRYSIK